MLFALPTEIQRRVLPYVGELDLCDTSDHSMHKGSLVFLDARQMVVCVPRQLYVVSHWHTWYPCGTKLQKLFRDVVPVHVPVRDTDTYELRRIVMRKRDHRRTRAAMTFVQHCRLCQIYRYGKHIKRSVEELEVYPSGLVPRMGHVIRSRPWGALEPFCFIVETNDTSSAEV